METLPALLGIHFTFKIDNFEWYNHVPAHCNMVIAAQYDTLHFYDNLCNGQVPNGHQAGACSNDAQLSFA